MVFEKRYQNGLRLVVKRMEGLLSVSAGIFVGTGGAFETDAEDGISHFIEHMQFKGTKKRSAFDISDAFDRIGASSNAFTGKDVTCYYAKCTVDHTEETFEILSDMFLNAVYDEKEMQREKGVVCEEISMIEDTPDDLCFDVLYEALYGKRDYGRNILGTAKNVQGFTKDDVLRYKRARYCPENTVISFAGGIDVETADKLVEKYMLCMEKGEFDNRKLCAMPLYGNLVRKKPIEQMHLAIAYPALPREHRLSDALQILNTVYGSAMSSRLFQEVREKLGLAYSVYSYASPYADTGSLIVYAGVNPAKAQLAYDAILNVTNELLQNGITEEEFLRGREQMKSALLFSQESTSSQMITYGKYLLQQNAVFDFDKKLQEIGAVTMNDIREVIEIAFQSGKKSVAIVGNSTIEF